jgi:RNA polymerase sigma-70 factor (ECF subfamily)
MAEAGAAERFRQSGDPDDFRALVDEHEGRVLRIVAGVLGPWSDLEAEEVAQEVFLRVLDRIGQWRGEAAFGAWLHRVALRTALNHRQRARLRLPHLGEEAFAGRPLLDDPAARLARGEEAAALAQALERLPPLYRTVLHLHYWLEASVEEIAHLLGVPIGTVKSYLSRGRDRLRRLLAGAEIAKGSQR